MACLSDFPVLVAQFDVVKNVGVSPDQVFGGSNRKVWWLCDRGHSWDSSFGFRLRQAGGLGACLVCEGKRVLAGFNDLATVDPALVTEWHPTRNGELDPSQVLAGSDRKVWWLGECGHEWEAPVGSRCRRGAGCPYCAGRRVLVGFNDLATTHSELAAEWHPTKNGELNPSQVSAGTRRKVWWVGSCGHEWEAQVLNRVNGNGCYQCLGRKPSTSQGFLVDDKVLLGEVHPTRNAGVILEGVRRFSLVKLWWVGSCGHEWEATVASRSSGHGCHFCSSNVVLAGFNDLSTLFSVVAAEWHPTKNESLTPDMVTGRGNRKVWWLGECGHEWEAPVGSRTGKDKSGCLICAGKLTLSGFNDLTTTNPDVAAEWHPTKNESLTPGMITGGSNRKVWWLCDRGHEWEARVVNRTNLGSGCPVCAAQTFVSKAEQEIADWVMGLGVETYTSVRNVIKGELDIYVPSKNVAVEFNGLYWHSEQFKDRFAHAKKRELCKEQGIQLIQVWEDDWNRNPDLVKRMLAHKLGSAGGVKTFARKTTVVGLKRNIVEPFLVENHLQGYRTAKYFGLIPKGGDIEKPVAVLGVARKGDDGLEIIRFAVSGTVVGGFTKLLSYAVKQYPNVVEVYSYSHNDHSDGGVYEKNGFELVHEGSPGYSYWKTGWAVREHRLKYSPSRVKANPDLIYEEGADERRLAALNGIVRVWDSGSSLWVKRVRDRAETPGTTPVGL